MKGLFTAFSLVALMLQGTTNYKVVGRYPIPGVGGFDYVTLDSEARRLYVSHGTQVEVVDADNGKLVGTMGKRFSSSNFCHNKQITADCVQVETI